MPPKQPPYRTTAILVLAAMLSLLAWWRFACILSGPDVDTDAYAHHMIGRSILADPSDLRVHWVWLPLFHYMQAGMIWLGGTMNTVRFANSFITVLTPVVLFRFIFERESRTSNERYAAIAGLIAAALFAVDPITMEIGTTAQPEPLFCLLILGFAIAFEKRANVAAGVLLAVAVLLRYEGWAVLLTAGALVARDSLLRLRRKENGWLPAPSEFVMLLLPAVAILTWAALRRPFDDGKWFAFLAQTREFAMDATKEKSSLDRGVMTLLADLLKYPVIVPGALMGPALLLVPIGFRRTYRVLGERFVLVLLACLGMVTFSWVTRGSLGLYRHIVVAIPLYAAFIANGVVVIAERARAKAGGESGPHSARAEFVALCLAAALAIAPSVPIATVWLGFVHEKIHGGFPDRAGAGAFLRTLPGDKALFCDDATIEILSGIDRKRFDRHWINDPATWDLVDAAANRDGEAFVATWASKLPPFLSRGEVIYRSDPKGAENTGISVMRVRRKP